MMKEYEPYILPAALTSSGRLSLLQGEVEIKLQSGVQLFLHNSLSHASVKQLLPLLPAAANVVAILTNLRLVLVVTASAGSGQQHCQGWGVKLCNVRNLEDCSTMFSSSKRLRILFHESAQKLELGIKFLEGGKEAFLSASLEVLVKKSWLQVAIQLEREAKKQEQAGEAKVFSAGNAGIGGIVRRQEKDMQAVDVLQRNALSDLDALARSAGDMVAVIQRYASYLQGRSDGETETESVAGELNEMDEIMQSIGYVNPVTKASAGKIFHQQLARQICDIMLSKDRIVKLGGMVSLTDLYCIINRTRGTELVSPDDLLQACRAMNTLKLGLHLKRFDSGVMVLQLDTQADSSLFRRVRDVIETDRQLNRTGANASSVAAALNLSVTVTKEVLIEAEKQGFLCRDDTVGGLFFFPNRFV